MAVANEENITRAADYLHVSQPTLSRQLMELEEEPGIDPGIGIVSPEIKR